MSYRHASVRCSGSGVLILLCMLHVTMTIKVHSIPARGDYPASLHSSTCGVPAGSPASQLVVRGAADGCRASIVVIKSKKQKKKADGLTRPWWLIVMLLREMREMPRKQTSVVVVFPLSAASNCWPVSGSTLPPRVAGGTAWNVLSQEASGVLAEERGVQRGRESTLSVQL